MVWMITAIVVLVAVGVLAWRRDKRTWNNGVCRENGQKWVLFDRDSQGGHGLIAGDVRRWVSWIKPSFQDEQYDPDAGLTERGKEIKDMLRGIVGW